MALLEYLTTSGSTPALERVLSFTQARHRMLTENIANIDTPGYRTRQLDTEAFRAEMRRAIDTRRSPDESLRLRSTRELKWSDCGRLDAMPALEPPERALSYDGTNARVERQMSMLAENGLAHQMAAEILRKNYDNLMSAVRGRAT